MLGVVRFWLDLGLDGFRLDAVPYLFERRRHQRREPARDPRLPEAHPQGGRRRATRAGCCWPRPTSGRPTSSTTSATATSATCASTSRSCPACSWRCAGSSATRSPRSWPRRPTIPDGCQWGIFLRNHDELTLEMVTDEERDYMYTEYAKDPRMKLNLGIRRRLAPLLDNDRRVSSCSTPCCSACPAARSCTTATRSAWATTCSSATGTGSARPCSGRPTATPGSPGPTSPGSTCRRMMDPVYGYQAVNVEAQMRNPRSLPALDPAHAGGPQAPPGVRHRAASRCSRPRTRRCSPIVRRGWATST